MTDGELIKTIARKRKTERLSFRALAAQTGTSYSTLCKLEKGADRLATSTRLKLMRWLGHLTDQQLADGLTTISPHRSFIDQLNRIETKLDELHNLLSSMTGPDIASIGGDKGEAVGRVHLDPCPPRSE